MKTMETSPSKICFKCNIDKPIYCFYKHKQMGDGHLNKCIECTKADVSKRYVVLVSTHEGLRKERKRCRDKYYRLRYVDRNKPSAEKKREIINRYNAKYPEKSKAKNLSASIKPTIKGNNMHHWSYKIENAKDIIELSVSDHNLAHRHMTYDRENYFYIDENGNNLDTKEKHIAFLLSLNINII